SSDKEWEESDYGNTPKTSNDSFFKPYLKDRVKNDIQKDDEQSQKKRKGNKSDLEIDDDQPNKRDCKAEKFEAIKYSLGPNKEYIAIKRDDENATNPPQVPPTLQAPHTLSTIKIPILKKGEYDVWAMRMEHYLEHTDYLIWEVIQKGTGPVQVLTDTLGQIRVLPLKTTKEILARERERKARTTLLMAMSEDHLEKFHKMTDAKEMWEAIKSRFGRNDESKKMQKYILKQQFEGFSVSNSEGLHKGYDRFQSLFSQLKIHGVGVSTEDANQKFLRSLPSFWSQVSLIMRNKPRVNTLSFDDLYNNLRVFNSDVKGSTPSSFSTQNVAFVSSDSTNSTNEVSTAYGVSTSSGHNSQKEGYRKRDAGNTRHKARKNKKRPAKQDEHKAMVTIDGEGVDWTGHAKDNTKNYALMAFNSNNSGSDTKVTSCSKVCEESYYKLKKLYDGKKEQLGVASIEIQAYTLALKKVEAQLVYHQKNQLAYEEKISRPSDVEDGPVNDRFAKVKGMHAVPPPMTKNYMPPKFDFGIDESKFTCGPKQSKNSESNIKMNNLDSCESNSSVETLESMPKPVESKPKAVSEPKVWSDAPIIEEYESDNGDEYVFKAIVEQAKPSCDFINTVKHVKLLGKLLKTKTHVVRILKFTKETGLV
nr:ribonuclease H-like domain-containing protein [Tanacetum cinerariifolium]